MHKIDVAGLIRRCTICPRECGIDRTAGGVGFCGAGDKIEVHSAHLHFGEEPPISGTNGSGTIFFNHCNMRCIYCQNYRFSQIEDGKEFEIDELADLMLTLQRKRACNINLVTPTHYAVHIGKAIIKARKKGLRLPILYNSSGYEKIQTLQILSDLIDIYLVDMRYGSNQAAQKYSSCHNYVEVNRKTVAEMHKQVGGLELSNSGIAKRGVIIRHLILPNNISNTDNVFRFISERLGKDTYLSVMSQYYPAHMAPSYNELSRGINEVEYKEVISLLYKYGLENGWVQEYMGGGVNLNFAGTAIEADI